MAAIDEETYRTPPFLDLPNALRTRQIAGVLDAPVAVDAKIVDFDVVFPTSIDRLVSGFDRDFPLALHNAVRGGRVVLGEVQHQRFPIHPFVAQSFASDAPARIFAMRARHLMQNPPPAPWDAIERLDEK